MPGDPDPPAPFSFRSHDDMPTWSRFQGFLLAIIVSLAILVLVFGVLTLEDSVVFLQHSRKMDRLIKVHQILNHLLIDILNRISRIMVIPKFDRTTGSAAESPFSLRSRMVLASSSFFALRSETTTGISDVKTGSR